MNPVKIAHLSWVRGPIEKYIERCKQAMVSITSVRDRINNPPTGAEPVWFANQNDKLASSRDELNALLSGIASALDVISSNGGYALANEMRTLASVALSSNDSAMQDKALLAIQNALQVLPGYIGMVIEGAHDSPGVLLNYINELRSLRDVPALTDDSALTVNLSFGYKSPPLHESDCDLTERERVFKKAAAQFCLLYTQAMKESGEAAWIEMREHLRALQRVTNDPELGCYWWVGEAIIDVIIADGCYITPAMTTALRVVMVATQRLPQGESTAKQALSPAKFSSLLNALSISRKITATAAEVVKHFDVKENVEEDRIAQLRQQLSSQSVQNITDVLTEIKPRLESAMIAFGRAVNAKHADAFAVQTQAFDQSMRTIANIFGIFNETELSEVSFYLADAVKGVKSPAEFTPDVIETVKHQILFLDSRLTHLRRNEAADLLQIENVTADVIERIATETTAELKKVSHMIATHVDSGVGSDKLLTALASLRELASVYEFAGSLSIAKILAAIVNVISDEVRGSVLDESERLTLAARALVALEMYLQYITSNLHPPATLIEAANSAVRELGQDVRDFRVVSHSDLEAKFDASSAEDDGLDALLREIFELRPFIEELQRESAAHSRSQLAQYAAACLRLSAAALIKGERKLADLCRNASELANIIPGRVDDPSFDSKTAASTLARASETILRCMDDYSAKGKVNLFLIDAIREVAAFIGNAPAAVDPQIEAQPEAAPSKQERTYPDGYDPQLQVLFDEEFSEQLAKLREYLERTDLTVTEAECRAIHNIHGCSGSASCHTVNTLFDVLEARFYALKANDDCLSTEQAESLKSLLDEVEQYQKDFPWEAGSSQLPGWLEIAGSITGTRVATEAPSEPESEPVAAASPPIEVEAAPEPVSAPEQLSGSVAVQISAVPDYDLEMYDLYLTDADDVIPELQRNIAAWMTDMSDKELTVNIRRNMHTLKGAAAIINATAIRSLTHHMESLFDSMASGAMTADKHCADLTTFVLNELITMSDSVRNREPYRTIPALIDLVGDACDMCRVDGDKLAAVIQGSYGSGQAGVAPAANPIPDATDDTQAAPVIEAQPPASIDSEPSDALELGSDQPSDDSTPVGVQAVQDDMADGNDAQDDQEDAVQKGRRGYRGLRGRAFGERQRNYESRQAQKSMAADGLVFDAEFYPGEPDYTDIVTANKEISPQVQALLHRATESDREALRSKRKGAKGSEKIKVELQLLDNSVKLSNELKASSYRQNTLHRESQLSVVALREKLSLLLMHMNKTTVQLRHFNNIGNPGTRHSSVESSTDDQRLYLERFNHLSHSHTQSILQIEQLLQDAQDMIAQSNLLDSAFSYQGEVIASLQRDLLQSRLVMFDNEKPSLNGALAGAIQLSQKKAELEVLGTDTRIDRQLLESIRDPLRHVVTNAVAHGIESEAERVKAGKSPVGKIQVKASRRAKSLIVEISDDGRGIDPKAIHRKALSLGLVKPEDQLSEQEILHLIAEQGFSTAKSVSELSGRGVGMDIVRTRIASLGGHLHIASELGKGTTISLELPLTVGSNRALVCRISDQWFAIPTFNMAQVLDFPTTELMAIKAKPGQASVSHEGKSYDVVHLADLMAVPDLKLNSAQAPSHTCLVLVEQSGTRLAIEVENGVSMPEIHVTKFEGILSTVKGIIGSTEVHDGTPALVLDVIELARLNLKMTEDGYKAKLYRIRRVKREARPLVLIVDDSSSYQKLLTRHFQALGWEVASAHNGQDALDKLPTLSAPSLFVVDVEMPRMNGLDLTERLRSLKNFDRTPIIMLTTRAQLKEQALSLGVNYFLPKPYDAAMLNEGIRIVCPELHAVGAA
ncbi:hybrid sensor histidine kinase/response regulator [Pseudomonas aeruginosa]|uniref:hybrid sensor histidine kinase/response regulator n=1 Tax=Pseudomonas aeruginosa TaxID=287 RepID=UPI0034E0ACB1